MLAATDYPLRLTLQPGWDSKDRHHLLGGTSAASGSRRTATAEKQAAH